MRRLALGLPGVLPELDQMRATRLWLMPLHTASHWSLLAVRRKGGDSPPEVERLLIDPLPSQEMRTIALHVLSRCAAVVPEWSIQTGDLREAVIATQTNSRVCGYRVAWHAAQVAAAPDSIPLVELEFDTPGDRELLSELGRRYEAFAFAMSPHIGSQERALLISD